MDRVLSLLGLANRAKKVLFGETVLERIREVKLMFIASDASEKTKERFRRKCEYYSIIRLEDYSSEEISNALGKRIVMIAGICDEGFAKSFREKLK